MEHSKADRALSEVEFETVSGGHAISASLERFAASNAGSDETFNALTAYAASLRRQPIGRK
jgi:hypothetical protein